MELSDVVYSNSFGIICITICYWNEMLNHILQTMRGGCSTSSVRKFLKNTIGVLLVIVYPNGANLWVNLHSLDIKWGMIVHKQIHVITSKPKTSANIWVLTLYVQPKWILAWTFWDEQENLFQIVLGAMHSTQFLHASVLALVIYLEARSASFWNNSKIPCTEEHLSNLPAEEEAGTHALLVSPLVPTQSR